MKHIRYISALAGSALLSITVAQAAVFPDVPDGHIHQKSIEALVSAGVVNGNPDGTFDPNRAVNRAELLKMLYEAAGKNPDPSSVRCFPDVDPGSWYEQYVCDAAANRYVGGYPDGSFKPGREVNRVEALKMIINILDIPLNEVDDIARDTVKFADVSVAAWYTQYLYTAYAKSILPIPGMDNSFFYPEQALLRAEAAAYIYNALRVELMEDRESREQSSASSVSSQTSSEEADDSSSSAQSSTSSVEESRSTEVESSFPFDTSRKFDQKKPFSFTFDLIANTTAYIEALAQAGKISCQLYLLKEDGFSEEYYLGHQEGAGCYLHAALRPGKYQLQLQPTVADATFSVSGKQKTGDGNDGFREAIRLYNETPKTAVLDVNDIQDFYMFVVQEEASMSVEITNALELRCIVFPMDDVDLFGFSGPECNQTYLYPAGTYYLSVSRDIASKASKKTYTIHLK